MMRILTENFGWKLASFLIALGLWSAIILEPDLVTSASVPIFFRNLPRGLEFAAQAPEQIVLEPSLKIR